jgi:hypothetical protein
MSSRSRCWRQSISSGLANRLQANPARCMRFSSRPRRTMSPSCIAVAHQYDTIRPRSTPAAGHGCHCIRACRRSFSLSAFSRCGEPSLQRGRDADSQGQQSGVPAPVPSDALVSDRPTVFLTVLNIPHHRHGLLELQMGAEKSRRPPEDYILHL